MKHKLYVISTALLFMAVSIYFGTGWSTAIFQFPVMPLMTPDNYYLHFIPQVDAATNFFTFLVTLMAITCITMIIGEWRTRLRWIPILLLIAIAGATALTYFVVFPVNEILRAGVSSQAQLMEVVGRWKQLTLVRVAIWSFEWALMPIYFGVLVYQRTTETTDTKAHA